MEFTSASRQTTSYLLRPWPANFWSSADSRSPIFEAAVRSDCRLLQAVDGHAVEAEGEDVAWEPQADLYSAFECRPGTWMEAPVRHRPIATLCVGQLQVHAPAVCIRAPGIPDGQVPTMLPGRVAMTARNRRTRWHRFSRADVSGAGDFTNSPSGSHRRRSRM